MTNATRTPPAGFTQQEWDTFERDGLLVLRGRIPPDAVAAYLDAVKSLMAGAPRYDPGHTFKIHNVVQAHPLLTDLIDHDRHVGYAYDLFGDQLRLLQADVFVRPTQGVINDWHIDGPRALPYRVFSPTLPLKLRIGYWLTDVPEPAMGNLIYLPGSHRGDYDREHAGIGDVDGQRTLCCPAGTVTIAHASLWHRVDANVSDRTRINMFLSYAPSWVTGYYDHDPGWLGQLSREQRLIMRAYDDAENLTRPPAADLPLFADDMSVVPSDVEEHKLRRLTRYERMLRYSLAG